MSALQGMEVTFCERCGDGNCTDARVKLRSLVRKHGITGVTVDPGGRVLRHPVHGEFRISDMDEGDDYISVCNFLRTHGVEP